MAERGFWEFPLWETELRRRWWPCNWRPGRNRFSIQIPMGTGRGSRRMTRWLNAVSGAGRATGWSIWTSRSSSTPWITRLSSLCGEVFPGQAEDVDFFGGRLVRARCLKSGGDDDAAELGAHVGGGRLGFAGVPGGAGPVFGHVGGVVAGGGVPAGGDGLAGELERDGPLDGAGDAVAGL